MLDVKERVIVNYDPTGIWGPIGNESVCGIWSSHSLPSAPSIWDVKFYGQVSSDSVRSAVDAGREREESSFRLLIALQTFRGTGHTLRVTFGG